MKKMTSRYETCPKIESNSKKKYWIKLNNDLKIGFILKQIFIINLLNSRLFFFNGSKVKFSFCHALYGSALKFILPLNTVLKIATFY